jgi:hypothetical protein
VVLRLPRASGGRQEPLSAVLPPPPPVLPTLPSGTSARSEPTPAPPPPRTQPEPAQVAPPPPRSEPAPRLDGEGTLMLASSPWCSVSIDGVVKGNTPLSIKLPAGKHTVVLTNPEFKIRRTLPVSIAPDETVRKRLDFAQ